MEANLGVKEVAAVVHGVAGSPGGGSAELVVVVDRAVHVLSGALAALDAGAAEEREHAGARHNSEEE
eukprot:CAMPEP_0175910284 /NCGR_PEP_ID=MMETSP0108-20121206/7584_1 /TAXON_ID=195067 ORGANISM="Goniomonas pacifica, Strain CCMP1869" /NCGR_SAMPLE_ID=MMETSP0108 /ASSEMBLY_ACC=CAM_ASM_000204 /LENGTH=66 /DNA_ID=CAMNT_0017232465 /DNA_START=54 /DNA_END=254 /DNA_ORIENTATION=-